MARLPVLAILATLASSCGQAPDNATRCANRVADMFGVRRDNVMVIDPSDMPAGDARVTGTVDTGQSPGDTPAFSCHFGADGRMTVEMGYGDSE